MGKNLTFKKELRYYNRGMDTVVADLDSPVMEDGIAHRFITETNNENLWCDNRPRMIVNSENHYLVGPIVDRLHTFEELGYEPEEIKEIIRRYRMYRLAMNSFYGGFTYKTPTRLPRDIDEMHELPVDGPYHVFMNGIKDVDHMYPKHMIIQYARCNGKTSMVADYIEKMIKEKTMSAIPQIESVRFNNPATIVFWNDGTKTVVKAQPGEPYDPEKGLAMAISKKALGNKGNYYNTFEKHLEGYEWMSEVTHIDNYMDAANDVSRLLNDADNAVAELASVLDNPKATKADMLRAMKAVMTHLKTPEVTE